MYELVIIFALVAGGGTAMEKHTAGPYATLPACDAARLVFITDMGKDIHVNGACLKLPDAKR